MNEKNEILKFIKENKEYLKSHFHVTRVGLFGSFARGDNRPESDIDILIELEPNTSQIYELKNEMRNYFQSQFHRPIDLAREKYLKFYAKNPILKETIYV